MKVSIEFELLGYTANVEGKKEIERIFKDLIPRLGAYWDTPLQAKDSWIDTTLVIYNEVGKTIGQFVAEVERGSSGRFTP